MVNSDRPEEVLDYSVMATCLTPITLKREQYATIDGSMTNVVPCGKCVNCIQRRTSEWAFRLREEQKVSSSSSFLTLTYNDETVPYSENGYQNLDIKDHQKFMKRLRKYIHEHKHEYPEHDRQLKLKYYMVGEYGTESHRPHYHSILFNLPKKLIEKEQIIEEIWGLGLTQVAVCNEQTIRYVTGYINKRGLADVDTPGQHDLDDRVKEFSAMSNGLGKSWLTPNRINYYRKTLKPFITEENGEKRPMPRYFRHKLYNRFQQLQVRKKQMEHIDSLPELTPKDEIDLVLQKTLNFKRRNTPKRKSI